jgi:hypothetical protein
MSYLTPEEKEKLVPSKERSKLSPRQVWYKQRKKVIEKVARQVDRKAVWYLCEILVVLLKIYYELKKPNRRLQ